MYPHCRIAQVTVTITVEKTTGQAGKKFAFDSILSLKRDSIGPYPFQYTPRAPELPLKKTFSAVKAKIFDGTHRRNSTRRHRPARTVILSCKNRTEFGLPEIPRGGGDSSIT
jgi:hypothetical protein